MDVATRTGDERRSVALVRVLAALAAAAVLALGLAGAHRSRLLTLERRASSDAAVVAAVASGVAVDIERALDAVASSAQLVPLSSPAIAASPRVLGSVPGGQALGYEPLDAGTSSGTAGSPLAGLDRADPELAALLDRTRDTGDAVLSAPIDQHGAARTLVVAAVYASQPGGPPRSTSARRDRVQGWVVASVDLESLARLHLPEGAIAAVWDGTEPPGAGTDLPGRLPRQTVEVSGRVLTVAAGDPSGIGVIAPTIAFVLVALLGAGAAMASVLVVGRRLRSQREDLYRNADQVRLIGAVAPLVQQSLELGEVLPAVAVQLTDHFGLAGVRLSTGSSSAGQLELFGLGERAVRPPKPVLRPPDRLAAGDALTLALQRGGRSVALLELVAGRDLGESDLQSLRAISELVTAAVVNASLYASQQTAVRRLRDLDALKTVFLSTASHELRTPATAIGGFAALLTNSWDRFTDDQRRDFAERIAANARSLSAVVQDLLDFSLLDRGAEPLVLAPIELGRLVEGVVDRLAPVFTDHQISCTTEPAPPVAGAVNGLERVVTNLLTNAVKFSPAGSTVTLSVGPRGDGAAVAVSDEGPGVPPEERQQVFARFYRGSGDAVLQTRGVGIGLSVVAELVSRMDGEITLDDAPGGGARFTVWLPASAAVSEEEIHDAATR
ncbi:MAG: ATP-binding protein [Acidimicrobiales bacterium]